MRLLLSWILIFVFALTLVSCKDKQAQKAPDKKVQRDDKTPTPNPAGPTADVVRVEYSIKHEEQELAAVSQRVQDTERLYRELESTTDHMRTLSLTMAKSNKKLKRCSNRVQRERLKQEFGNQKDNLTRNRHELARKLSRYRNLARENARNVDGFEQAMAAADETLAEFRQLVGE